MMTMNKEYYNQDIIWSSLSNNSTERERIQFAIDRIPVDVKTVLDIGCGNGLFTNCLVETHRSYELVCATDFSLIPLNSASGEAILSTASHLPFKENAFDLVTCFEVLEHLPIAVYNQALVEMASISKKYIFLSVPYRERIQAYWVQCPYCHTRFNPHFHVRSFNESTVKNLFLPWGYQCLNCFYLGRRKNFFLKPLINHWKRIRGNFPSTAVCPVCGYSKESPKIQPETNTSRNAGRNLWPGRTTPKWILSLFTKQTG